MEMDDKVCICFGVSRRKLVNFTRQTQPSRPSQLSNCFGAGTGCGWCIPFLMRIHAEGVASQGEDSPSSRGAANPLEISAEEYQQLRSSYRQQVNAGELPKNSHRSGGSLEGDAGEDDSAADDSAADDSAAAEGEDGPRQDGRRQDGRRDVGEIDDDAFA
ncbi:MAG: (2Fe-2S)-binding protein [Candidatus Poseidoniia archaeon]